MPAITVDPEPSSDDMATSSQEVFEAKHGKPRDSDGQNQPLLRKSRRSVRRSQYGRKSVRSFRSIRTSVGMDDEEVTASTDLFHKREELSVIFHILFPIVKNWPKENKFEKVIEILSVPFEFALGLTVPVVHYIEITDPTYVQYLWWSKYLVSIQCFLAPVFSVFCLGVAQTEMGNNFYVWELCLILGACLSVLVFFTTRKSRPPKFYLVFCVLGFFVSIFWLQIIATNLLGIIRALGEIIGISESLLGLTILAWGNSSPGLIANLAISRKGFPSMAVAACFGEPLLNLLLGFGVSYTYVILSKGENLQFQMNPTLIITFSTLIVIIVSCLIFIPLKKYKGTKYLGIFLISLFVLSSLVNILNEVLHFYV